MTTTAKTADCLIEIGMEEIPPKALKTLSLAFTEKLGELLGKNRLSFGGKAQFKSKLAGENETYLGLQSFAAPRRLAVIVQSLATEQPDEDVEMRGPPVHVAFDKEGKPGKAAEAFAKKCGVNVGALQTLKTDKGEWLVHREQQSGVAAAQLLAGLVQEALAALPIPRRMRWGASQDEFIRPVHWLVMLHGDEIIPGEVFGIQAGRTTRGHRFHSSGELTINGVADYEALLHKNYVIADFAKRRAIVWQQASDAAKAAGGHVEQDDALIDEVTALCDWPVAVTGEFDARFLTLPWQVLESTLKVHQRYFPVRDSNGKAINRFITLANIESRNPDEVKRGNERVVAPRLADAAFFWKNDLKTPLAERCKDLSRVVYQRQLGSLGEKSARVSKLVALICAELATDDKDALRAAKLGRCDLLTDMVGEFPDLQGVMGQYYAKEDGERDAVGLAIAEQYLPRFAGDEIPASSAGQVLSIAERVDTLAGIFAIGKKPSGNRDPFALRRTALGLLRVLIEGEIDLDLLALLQHAVAMQPVEVKDHPELAEDLYDYITERLRNYYQSQDGLERNDIFAAVLSRTPRSALDFNHRMLAVAEFVKDEAAEQLAAANKRIANILRSGGVDAGAVLDPAILEADAEKALHQAMVAMHERIAPAIETRDYQHVLAALSELRAPVDQFFDDVMVMDEDVSKRRNRMALLSEVRGLFLEVADISELVSGAS